VVLHQIQYRPWPFLLGTSLGTEITNELADDFLSLSVGTPLLEVDAGASCPSLNRQVGGIYIPRI